MKRKLVLALAATFAVSTCIVGCGEEKASKTAAVEKSVAASEEEEEADEEEPFDNPSDFMKAYYEQKTDNYNLLYVSSMNMEISAEDESVEIPIRIKMDMDCTAEHVHGNMLMEMDLMGSSDSQEIEMYTEAEGDTIFVYQYDENSDQWIKTVDDTTSQSVTGFQEELITEDKLKDADFSYNEKEEQYEMTVGFSDVSDYGMLGSFLSEDMMDMFSGSEEDIYEDLQDAYSEVEIHYIFDKNLNPISIVADELNYTTEINEDGVEGQFSLSVGMKMTFSDHGKIKEKDVTVPKEVKESAVDLSDSDYDWDSVLEDDLDLDLDLDSDQDDSDQDYDSDDSNELTEEELAACGKPDFSMADFYGSINGTNFKMGKKNDFDKTFGAAGFILSESNIGEYGFASMDYPDDEFVMGTVYPKDTFEDYEDINKEIKENGFYGYTVSVLCCDEAPDMTFGGLTWGASFMDVLKVYGEPESVYRSGNLIMADYYYDDNIYIEFNIDTDKSFYPGGLYEVMMHAYVD